MPLYNAELYVEEAIKSVLNQTYEDWELIIINDCSTDNSLNLVKKISEMDSRILVYSLEKNGGSAVARNYGLKKAEGRFISFLDADDLLDPTYLEKQIAFIRENNAAIVSASYRRMATHTTTNFYVPKMIDYKLLLKGNPLSCLTTFYDKSVVGDRFFPENLRKCEDYVFWLDILKTGIVAYGNAEVLATYRILDSSKSHNKFKLIKYMYLVYFKTQKINFLLSAFYVLRWAIYGLKKYKNVN